MVGEGYNSGGEQFGTDAERLRRMRDLGEYAAQDVAEILQKMSLEQLGQYVKQGRTEKSSDYIMRLMDIQKGNADPRMYQLLFENMMPGIGIGEQLAPIDQVPEVTELKTDNQESNTEVPDVTELKLDTNKVPDVTELKSDDETSKAGEKVDDLVKSRVDRYGNPMTPESAARLRDLAVNDPEAFERELMAWNENQELAFQAAEKAGFKSAQAEIARVLDGKTPEQYLTDASQRIEDLRDELNREMGQTDVGADEAMRAAHSKRIAEMKGDLSALGRRYRMVGQMKLGENAIPVDPDSLGDLSTDELAKKSPDTLATMFDPLSESYNTNKARRRSEVENLIRLGIIRSDEAETFRKRLNNQEALEKLHARALRGELAEDETPVNPGEPSAEDVMAAAAAAEEGVLAGQKPSRAEAQASSRTGKQEADDYWKGLKSLKDEARAGRFDQYDDELQRTEREARIEKILSKARKRKFFHKAKRNVLTTVAMLALSSTLLTTGAGMKSEAAGVPAAATTVENDNMAAETDGGLAATHIDQTPQLDQSIAEQLVFNEAELYEGLIDFEGVDLQAQGAKFYEGYMDREGSDQMENGVYYNSVDYDSSEKHSLNSYGTSCEYIYDIQDSQERQTAAIDKILEISRDQPHILASFAASAPKLLEAAGVDQSVIEIPGVEARADAVANLMLADDGAALQQKLMGAIDLALKNENTDFVFYLEYGNEGTFYLQRLDANVASTPDNLQLHTAIKQRNAVKQLQLVFHFADGTTNISDKNLYCGMQENLDVETGEINTTITLEDGQEVTVEEYQETVDATETPEQTPKNQSATTTPDIPPVQAENPEPKEDDQTPVEEIKAKDRANLQSHVDQGGQSGTVTNNSELLQQTQEVATQITPDEYQEILMSAVGTEVEAAQQQEADAKAQELEQVAQTLATDDSALASMLAQENQQHSSYDVNSNDATNVQQTDSASLGTPTDSQ